MAEKGKNSVALYMITLKVGPEDFTNHLYNVELICKRVYSVPIFQITLRLNREQYETYLKPFKHDMVIEIKSYRGMDDDDSTDIFGPIIKSHLTVLHEVTPDQSVIVGGPENVSPMTEYTFITTPLDLYKKQQKLVKNLSFLDKTRKDILQEVLDGQPHEILSPEFEGPEIEQVIIPPVRLIGAIQYLHHRWKLFDGGEPIFTTYSLMDKKLYMGSCNRILMRKMKFLEIYVGSEHQTPSDGPITQTGKIANKETANKYRKGSYSVSKPIKEKIFYVNMAGGIGRKQIYCYNPIDDLYSRVVFDIKDMERSQYLNNLDGETSEVLKHLSKTVVKTTWHHQHNGLLPKPEGTGDQNENRIFPNSYSSEFINQCIELEVIVEGNIELDDFIYPGRSVRLVCDKNSMRLNGRYYLEESVLKFSHQGMYWACTNTSTIKTGIDVGRLND